MAFLAKEGGIASAPLLLCSFLLQGVVIGVRHRFAPLGLRAFTRHLNREMLEPGVFRGTVLVLHVCRNIHDVTRLQSLSGLTPLLIPAAARGHEQNLTAALRRVVDMPVVAAPGLKRDVSDRNLFSRKHLEVADPRKELVIGIPLGTANWKENLPPTTLSEPL